MSNLKDIKNRIHSVKSTQKITKAMKMISTARLNKARIKLENHLQYSIALQHFVTALLPSVDMKSDISSHIVKNFFQGLGQKKLVVIISTDKGLCGALNTFVFKEINDALESDCIILPIGKKAFEYTKSRFSISIERPFLTSKEEQCQDIIETVLGIITKESIGSVQLIYPEFISTMVQKPKVESLIPSNNDEHINFLIEGCPIKILENSIMEMIQSSVLSGILQLLCSENAARMIAMDSATNNAKERIQSLTLVYNKTRQANITREILEIVAGSQAV